MMFRPENILPENISHVEGVSDDCFQMVVGVRVDRKGFSQEEAIERAVGIWSTLHGLVLLGDNSGLLHQKVARDRERALAKKFVQLLVQETWPEE
ncbi:WHG domain-containing protein (plasmid) [Rhizobium sp. 007]|nr:WHG domain-containing protein [Rhizobium sp. 007]